MLPTTAAAKRLTTLTTVEQTEYTDLLCQFIRERNMNTQTIISSTEFEEVVGLTTEEFTQREQVKLNVMPLEMVCRAEEMLLELRLLNAYGNVNIVRDYSPESVLSSATFARVQTVFDFFGLTAEVVIFTHDPYDTESEQEVAEFFRTLRLSSGIRREHILFSF